MFERITLVRIPSELEGKFVLGYKFLFASLGVMFTGMIAASLWQWAFDIKATGLMVGTPLMLHVMMIGGFSAFLASLFYLSVGLPSWYEIQKRFPK